MRPIYKFPEQGREEVRTGQAQQAAIMAAADPMLRDVEVRSGMVPDANVLQANLMPSDRLTAQEAYLTALRSQLPGYVNAYRAKLAEDAKKAKAASGSGGGDVITPPSYNYQLPPTTQYLPNVGLVPDINRNIMYGVSPYGAMPMGQLYQLPPAATTLARRMAASRNRMAVE